MPCPGLHEMGSVLGDGDVALVTGSTGGIGREIARNLSGTGATVLVHGRDRKSARRTVAALRGDGHDWYLADFTDFDAVSDLADDVMADYDRLDCLVHNAGTWQGTRRLVTVPGLETGVERTFAINHLAPFLLTARLADRLVETGDRRRESNDGTRTDHARVVTVASENHRWGSLDLDAVRGPRGPSGLGLYNLSKLANVMFTRELARRLPDAVTANCCHPGVSPTTDIDREGAGLFGLGWKLLGQLGPAFGLTDSPAEAARTPTYLARSPDVSDVSGAYFKNCERSRPADVAFDREAQGELWAASEEWAGVSGSTSDRLTARQRRSPGL